MALYRVTAMSFVETDVRYAEQTGARSLALTGQVSTEVVNTRTNEVFRGCKGPWDVEDMYEAFWNRLNDSWERRFPAGKERVKVLRVEEVQP